MRYPIQILGLTAGLLLLGASACSQATPEQQFLEDALGALGGRDRVAAVRTLTIEGEGVHYNFGQDLRPEAATQMFQITEYTRVIDVAGQRQRVEQVRTPQFGYWQGPQPQRQIQGLDGAVAFNVGTSGSPSRLGDTAAADRRAEFLHHPLTALRAAMETGNSLINVRTAGNVRQAEVKTADHLVTITIDAAGVPLSVSSKAAHPNLGDVVVTTTFAEYQDVNGLRLPVRFSNTIDDFTMWTLRATRQAIDADTGDLAAPASVAAARPAAAPPQVSVEPVGKGVWLLAGAGHHSALVEFADHLMLIEAPQSEARTLAVIAKAKETVPNKPLTQLVTTHHHFDHTAGLRAAIAEGMNVITHAGNEEWVERMAARPHTIQPDTLAKNATRLVVETVDDEREIADQTMTVQLYHVAGNPHSDTMLMAYVPSARVLIQADAYSPELAPHLFAANLLENIEKHNLRVDRIVPLHGPIVPMAELVNVVRTKE